MYRSINCLIEKIIDRLIDTKIFSLGAALFVIDWSYV